MTSDTVDPVAFQRFEQAGWEWKTRGYHTVYAPISCYDVDQLLDTAGVGPACGRAKV